MTTQIAQNKDYSTSSIEDFRGDFEQLAAVMKASWDQNAKPPFVWRADFVADCFRYPGAGFHLAPSLYHGDELVAFSAGFPRRIRVEGRELNVIVSALLTASADHRGKGYGIAVLNDLLRRATEAGFDGVINHAVDGETLNRLIEGNCRRLGLPVMRTASFSYLSKLLFAKGSAVDTPDVPPELLVKAAAGVGDEVGLARVWSVPEAAWQLNRAGSVVARGGGATDPAILTGYVIPVSDRRETQCLVVEDVFWGALGPEDRVDLVREFTAQAAAAGARVAIVPLLGYADLEPFRAAGFRPSQRLLHQYLTIWRGPMPAEAPAATYVDVI